MMQKGVCWLRLRKIVLKPHSRLTLRILAISLVACQAVAMFSAFFLTAEKVQAAGTTYYVSKAGNDNNPGTEAQPWLTIQKAASRLVAGDTVYVKAGAYYETVTPANSGTASNWIYYKTYPGDSVAIDGSGFNTGRRGLFFIGSKSYLEINGFEIRNSQDWAGVYSYGEVHYINLKNLTIHDTFSSGILMVYSYSYTPGKLTNITIDGAKVYNICLGGIAGSEEAISLVYVDQFAYSTTMSIPV
jgi:hypothetical protein